MKAEEASVPASTQVLCASALMDRVDVMDGDLGHLLGLSPTNCSAWGAEGRAKTQEQDHQLQPSRG